ncbi:protein ARV1-like [Liolophura sinensis]|uniref:protein ARV1-like n=1 Tax=Liolophura sinensis TaxID=3198878 RepID=UPI003158962D
MSLSEGKTHRCIQCGRPAQELYHDYQADVIKIAHCEHCQGVVDKYIEFDPVVILLDAFLLKRQAFRHVLYNTDIQSHWKLTLVFLLCDAYTKLFRSKGAVSEKLKPDYVFYSALEWDLYVMFFIATAEMTICVVTMYALVCLVSKLLKHSTVSFREVLRGTLLSNFGKLLVVPAILWGQSDSLLYLWLTKTFVLGANVQAVRVVCQLGPFLSFVSVSLAHLLQLLAADWLHSRCSTSGIG